MSRKKQRQGCEEGKTYLRKWHLSADLHEVCYGSKRKIWVKIFRQRELQV